MKTIDKYERVASLALNARKTEYGPSAFTIAELATQLERIGKRTHRIGTQVVNGEIDRLKGTATIAKAVAKASALVKSHGFTADDSSDGMGYLRIYTKAGRDVATFGGDS